jgi:16S rRNA (guanine527-N7)-methyltransferase
VTNEQTELESGVRELGHEISPIQSASLLSYLEQLDVTNRSFNLTRIPREDYVKLHLLDSLTALTCLPAADKLSIIDIGTGAGFPGVPLAALLPSATVTLLDSTAKKVRFAADTAAACGITNCVGLHARAEVIAHDPKHRQRYDVVTSRAVATFSTLIELMLPLVKVGGRVIALKGARADEELSGSEPLVRELGGAPAETRTVALPGTDIQRQLIVVEKIRATPGKYPGRK